MSHLPFTRLRGCAAAALLAALCGVSPRFARAAPPDGVKKVVAAHAAATMAAPAALNYAFKTGETHRYHVKAYFDGIIPPFSHPGGEPIHMLADIIYVSKVNKQNARGAEVTFSVESADLSLLLHEVKPDDVVKPDDQTPFPIELSDIQKALNATAVLRPDGTVSEIISGNPNAVKINIGFDLRKLFLLTMPVTFPPKAIKAGDTWTATEGVLGSSPTSIHYSNSLTRVMPASGNTDFQFEQTGTSTVSDTLDEQNNHTSKPDAVVSTLKGDITLQGTAIFSAQPRASANGNVQVGRMKSGRLNLKISLERKTTKADVAPEIKESTDGVYDVKARLLFNSEDGKSAAPQAASGGSEKAESKR